MMTSDCPPHQVREAFVFCDEEVRTASLAYREGTSNYVAGSNLRQLGALRLQLGWLKRQIQKLASMPTTALAPCIFGAPLRAPPAHAARRPRTPTKLTVEALDRLVGSGMGVMLGVAPYGGALLPQIHSPRTSRADAAAALSVTERARIEEMTKLATERARIEEMTKLATVTERARIEEMTKLASVGTGTGSVRQMIGSAVLSARSHSARAAARDLSSRDRSPARLQVVEEDEDFERSAIPGGAVPGGAVPGGAGATAPSSVMQGLRMVEAKLGDEEARLTLLNEKLAALLR